MGNPFNLMAYGLCVKHDFNEVYEYGAKRSAGTGLSEQFDAHSNAPVLALYRLYGARAVGIYWISSNLIAVVQTIILNNIYNPVKIRAQAEKEYEERRRQKLEDKKRLAAARARENADLNAANQKSGGKTKAKKPSAKKPVNKEQNEQNVNADKQNGEPSKEEPPETGEPDNA